MGARHPFVTLLACLACSSGTRAEPDDPYSLLRRTAEHRGQLVELCNELGLDGNAIELGVWHGGFSRHNLRKGKFKRYYMVDPWTFRANDTGVGMRDKNFRSDEANNVNYRIALKSVSEFGDRAVVMRRFASTTLSEFPDRFFDFIYIDMLHGFDSVSRDLAQWWPKLRPGGMMAGDDCADAHDEFPEGTMLRARQGAISLVFMPTMRSELP
mmetsp:Transcript_13840/g.35878  ORF Transcript_13840/g.35878 Transcript_13840/m.35878 type:complete len:212 (-) Transcript_13840:570-1205(-)